MTDAPEFSPATLLRYVHRGIEFDQVDGLGSVPLVQDIGYRGIVALMKPSVFLKLASRLTEGPRSERMLEGAKSSRPLGMPYLRIEALRAEEIQIYGHEGRNRAMAVSRLCGDEPMPIAIVPNDMRARDITMEHVERLAAGARREAWEGDPYPEFVEGPLFEEFVLRRQLLRIDPAPAAGMTLG